jgi:outer membrane protein assembly factor BamB
VFMALNVPSSNSSWLQALRTSAGSVAWQSQALNDTLSSQLELQAVSEGGSIVLATTAASDAILAYNASNGTLLWRRNGSFCPTPSPIVDAYRDQLLLSTSCEDLTGLVALDLATGKEQWKHWAAPSAARPFGNCSSYSQVDGSILFGCSCATKSKWQWQEGGDPQPLVGDSSSSSSDDSRRDSMGSSSSSDKQLAAGDAGWGVHGHGANGVCLYSLSSRTGKLRWVLPMVGNASFPEGAQVWGMAPVVYKDIAVFLATDRLTAVDLVSGKLRWVLPLQRSEFLQARELPVVDAGSGMLVLAAQVSGGTRTGLSGVSLREGRLLWHKTVNGTVQVGQQPSEGPQQLMVAGGRVYVEACRRSRCCLRALNVSSGKQRWGMCLDAVQGDDATHPHAQFAIWFITLLTIVSIALLILGAALVYFQRW